MVVGGCDICEEEPVSWREGGVASGSVVKRTPVDTALKVNKELMHKENVY